MRLTVLIHALYLSVNVTTVLGLVDMLVACSYVLRSVPLRYVLLLVCGYVPGTAPHQTFRGCASMFLAVKLLFFPL